MTRARQLLDQLLEAPMYSFEPVHRVPDELPELKFRVEALRYATAVRIFASATWGNIGDPLTSHNWVELTGEIFIRESAYDALVRGGRFWEIDPNNPPPEIVRALRGRDKFDAIISSIRRKFERHYSRWRAEKLDRATYVAPVTKRPVTKVVPFNVAELKGKLGDLKYIYVQIPGTTDTNNPKSANLELLANLAHEMEPGEKIYRIIKDTGMPGPETSMSSTAAIYFAATPEEAQGVFELVDAMTRAKAKKKMRGGV